MPFTYGNAKAMVGSSTDWAIGLRASITKWEQIASGNVEPYAWDSWCGCCLVRQNRGEDCPQCPADYVCGGVFRGVSAEDVLRLLRAIELEGE